MPMPHRPDVPCEEQELPNLHAPGGPIPAFPVLDETPGLGHQAAGARVPDASDFVDSAKDFVDDVLPLVAKERAAYQRREAASSRSEEGGG